jgi:hypothetical protein
MKTNDIHSEEQKILKGLEKVYEKLVAFKKAKNSELVVMENGKIVRIKPEELDAATPNK